MAPRAIILCAGLGTRLRPLTDEIPKPLLPVGDRPLLLHIIDRIRAAGISEIALNVHHLHSEFSSVIDGLGFEVRVFYEPQILGTAGGIVHLRDGLGQDPVLVWNGDTLTTPPIPELLAATLRWDLVLAVAPRSLGDGPIGMGAERQVVRLRGRSFGTELASGDYVTVSALSAAGVRALPSSGCLFEDYALKVMAAGQTVGTVPAPSNWTDIGSLRTYLDANYAWLEKHGESLHESWVAPDAHVGSGVLLSRSVVGAGAEVTGSGPVDGCVILPGARATAPLRSAVITRGGRIVQQRET